AHIRVVVGRALLEFGRRPCLEFFFRARKCLLGFSDFFGRLAQFLRGFLGFFFCLLRVALVRFVDFVLRFGLRGLCVHQPQFRFERSLPALRGRSFPRCFFPF